ncbi:MAG: tetratricopeptide repeat protein [Planctomycetes bacterium]|nr:tetratricopeptide repeat protein [Planctomycetota bacterium]
MPRARLFLPILLLALTLASTCRLCADDPELPSLLDKGRALARAGQKLEAVETFEEIIRRAESMPPKYEARDEILKIGPIPPRSLTDADKATVAQRIADEKIRHFRERADRAHNAKDFHAELLLQQAVLETQIEPSDDVKQKIADIKQIILHTVPEDEDKLFKQAQAVLKGEALLKEAPKWEEKKKYLALLLYKECYYTEPDDGKKRELALKVGAIEEAICADVPPHQKKFADEAILHPAWKRLDVIPGHHFIYIGDRDFIARIPGESRLYLDLAYLFITDLNAYPEPGRDAARITVFFKELWDFPGGVGGGRIIDIGHVDVKQKDPSVSNGLFYHELSHCLFQYGMIHPGFVEGIANFGATYAFDALGFRKEARDSIASNYGQFEKDFLGREMKYWRIQNYGPSCGFWLHFLTKYGKDGDDLDWSKYRRFFRLLAEDPFPREETYEKIRYFGQSLAECFGPAVWADLERFGFPIDAKEDPTLIDSERGDYLPLLEQGREQARRGDLEAARETFRELIEKHPESHLAALARRELLLAADQRGDSEALGRLVQELGIILDWKSCGPFYSPAHTALQDVFPPEYEIDYAKVYPNPYQEAKWFDPEVRFDGTMEYKFHYPENCAAYAVTWFVCPKETEGYVWIGSDDKHAIWLNHRLVEKRDTYHGYLFDQDRHRISVRAGWNKMLVKIANVAGNLGFGGRITDLRGEAIPGITFTTEPQEEASDPPAGRGAPAPHEGTSKGVLFKDDFRNKQTIGQNWVSKAGAWKVQNGKCWGLDSKRNVKWRKFVVTPGVEKDAPANQIWLKPQFYKGVKDFRIEMALTFPNEALPKFTVMLDGEGEDDGLSGWTLVFLPGDERIGVRLEEYDRLVFHAPAVPLKRAKEFALKITRLDGLVSVTLNDAVVFDRVHARPLKRDFIGIATFGPQPAIERFTLTALASPKKK